MDEAKNEDRERLTLTVDEVAALLGISRGLAYELARCGKLPALRLGRRLLIPRSALKDLLSPRKDHRIESQLGLDRPNSTIDI